MSQLDTLITNTIRCYSVDVVEKANSGHPGAPMGLAPLAHVLWSRHLKFNPSDPKWYNRDRFVLSNGHACALLYTILHLTGYEQFTEEQLKNFRQLESITAGHPEGYYDGIEVTTGPLGQGFSNAVGLAMAEAHLASVYNRPDFEIFNNHTYVFCGDGCMMEGITSEAASLAGHLKLNKLIVFYDDNAISIDGSTELAFTEDVEQRFKAYGWHTIVVKDGDHDFQGMSDAIEEAKRITDRPTLIKVRTTIGFASKNEGTEKVHGSPLGKEDVANVKRKLGFDEQKSFFVPDEVKEFYKGLKKQNVEQYNEWVALFEKYAQQFPKEAEEIKRRFNKELPANWTDALPRYTPKDAPVATRKLSQNCLQALYNVLPELMGGSADLAPSNLTIVNGMTDFQPGNYSGRNIRFGVREHAMGAIVNGLSAYGGYISYGATFLNFLGYMLGAVTLTALTSHKAFYIMTHDSIGLGEDGPTHQPIEKYLLSRSTPNMLFFRPADGNEVSGAYWFGITDRRPSIFALSRQNLPHLEGTSPEKVGFGGYILQETDSSSTPDVIIVSTGSEVSICVDAAKSDTLKGVNVRIVSLPCWELFDEQPLEYRLKVFPHGVPILSVEAGTTFGWSRYAHTSIGVDSFGLSGKYQDIYKKFGLTPEGVAVKAQETISFAQSFGTKLISPVALSDFTPKPKPLHI